MKTSLVRIIGAVLAGYVAIGILVFLTDLSLAAIRPGERVLAQELAAAYFLISLSTAPLYCVFGGWLCAWIARTPHWKPIIALAIFGEAMGVVSTIMFWGKQPFWYALALLIVYPPAVFLGGYLYRRRAAAASASV